MSFSQMETVRTVFNDGLYLKNADPVLATVIEGVTLKPIRPKQNYFEALASEIISQQLSGRVADVMEARFRALFPGVRFPDPSAVLSTTDEAIRTAGISYSKISYIKNLARATEEGALDKRRIKQLPDEDIIALLTQIKGVGRWTAEMFLMFTLGRPDVFSYGDLGLKNALIRLYKLRKSPSPARAAQISNTWRPFRTLACRYLWASIDGV
jgi:DNA-3-methyladenine glycosylase II